MCQQVIGKVISIDGNKAMVEINGKIYEMLNPFARIDAGDFVICAANYIIEKLDEGEFFANKK
ncbi:MAG: HypC/HybG/HupF family hydrogenase formation chaperone [Candidatus Micrarchaeia archaeon]